MKVGDLVVHIGATPNGWRTKLVCAIETVSSKSSSNRFIADKEIILFADGMTDFKEYWVVFDGWGEWK